MDKVFLFEFNNGVVETRVLDRLLGRIHVENLERTQAYITQEEQQGANTTSIAEQLLRVVEANTPMANMSLYRFLKNYIETRKGL